MEWYFEEGVVVLLFWTLKVFRFYYFILVVACFKMTCNTSNSDTVVLVRHIHGYSNYLRITCAWCGSRMVYWAENLQVSLKTKTMVGTLKRVIWLLKEDDVWYLEDGGVVRLRG